MTPMRKALWPTCLAWGLFCGLTGVGPGLMLTGTITLILTAEWLFKSR